MRFVSSAVAAAAVVMSSVAVAETEIKPWTPTVTPRLALTDLHGRAADLEALRGRVVIVNFWATWCVPCRDELPSLQRLRERFAGKPLEVITVNYGEFPQRVRPFLEKERLALPVWLDTQKEAARDWGVGGLPMTFVVDASSRARYRAFGEMDWTAEEAVILLEQLVREAPRARR